MHVVSVAPSPAPLESEADLAARLTAESASEIVWAGPPPDPNGALLPADSFFAYRLLLRRNPDLALEMRPLLESALTLRAFEELLLASPEFQKTGGLLPADRFLMSEVEGFRFWFNTSDREMGVRMGLGLYEPETVELVKRLVRPGMRCLDVGAQTGFFTCLMASCSKTGRIYAFEPMPASFQLLERNLRENHFERRVTTFPHACSSEATTLEGSLVSRMYVVGSAIDGREPIAIEAVRIDDVVDDHIDFIKIDIEGHEPAAISGMAKLLRRDRPIIVTEANDYWLRTCCGASAGEYVQLLESHDYAVYRVEDLETRVDGRAPWPNPLEAVNLVAVPSELGAAAAMGHGKPGVRKASPRPATHRKPSDGGRARKEARP